MVTYNVMVAGVAVKLRIAVGAGKEMLTGPLPVPIGTEHTDSDAFSPIPQ